jgi:hypothetical protein
MHFSPAQWDVIRRIAAEQARKVINSEYRPSIQEGLDLGLTTGQIDEIGRIARATARKQVEQNEFQKSVELHQKSMELHQKSMELHQKVNDLTNRLAAVEKEVTKLVLKPMIQNSNVNVMLHDGMTVVVNGEKLTFFRGEWRRRSELEGFASAGKYL